MNMARRTGVSARTQALAKATEAVARRDSDRIAREKKLQATLADFYQAQGAVERIHSDAKIAAAPFEASIREAVRTLDQLGETRAGIVGLTGLSLPRVRECLTEPSSGASAANGSEAKAPTGRVPHANGETSSDEAPPNSTDPER
jgi:hypothetical protein